MMNNKIEPRCSPRPRRQSAVIEALGKYPSIAKNRIATETPRHDHKPNLPSGQRQIGEAPLIPTMDALGTGATSRTGTRVAHGTDDNHGRGAVTGRALHIKAARDQGRRT
jgi:hypothetical protein